MSNITDKNFYNQSSSKLLGWTPEWFGCDDFDNILIERIKTFQKTNHLTVDGLCGPQTYKKIYTEHEFIKNNTKAKIPNYINVSSDKIEIKWDKFVGLTKDNKFILPSSTYRFRNYKKPIMFTIHHDATLSSKMCYNILLRRGLSVQFSIDNDGTIYQFVDCINSAQHIGHLNSISIGVEVSNAVELKYQDYYVNNGFGKRSIIKEQIIHGSKYKNFMGLYPIQYEALKVLTKIICTHYGINFDCPKDENGNMLTTLYQPAIDGNYNGIINHFHVDKNKWDCAGLDLCQLVNDISQ